MATSTPGEHQQVSAPPAAPGTHARVGVLFLDTTPFFGPLMQVHGRVMRHLDTQGHQVWLMADSRSGSPEALRDLPHLGIWVHPLVAGPEAPAGKGAGRLRQLMNQARVLAGLPRAARKVRKHGIDILHVGMTFRMMAVGLFLSVASGARLVIHAHQTPRLGSTSGRLPFIVPMAVRAGAA